MAGPRGQTHVLIVEPDAAEVNRIVSILDGMFVWEHAATLPDAERKVQSGRPRVVLISDEWGDAGTRDFCRRLKTGPLRRDLVVVTLTRGDPRLVQLAWGQSSGVDLQLRKPVQGKAVLDCLRLAWQLLKKGEVHEAVPSPDPEPEGVGPVSGHFPEVPAAPPSGGYAAATSGEPRPAPPTPVPPRTLMGFLTMEIDGQKIRNLFRGRRDSASGG